MFIVNQSYVWVTSLKCFYSVVGRTHTNIFLMLKELKKRLLRIVPMSDEICYGQCFLKGT